MEESFTTETNSHVSIDEVSFTFTFTLEPNSMPLLELVSLDAVVSRIGLN